MKAQNIAVGMTLKLKRERQDAYALPVGVIRVERIVERNGYKVPFICEGDAYFLPSDFAKAL